MPREIKFRAKSLNEKWVEGYYVKFETRQICPMGEDKLKDDEIVHLISRGGFADWNMPKQLEFINVNPETVGQYTILKDKNGREICEGDIVKEYESIGLVTFYGCEFRIAWMINKDHFNNSLACHYDHVEVIGNKHDNPELLKGGI